MKEFLVYTAARFAVFLACVVVAFGLFWLIGADDDVPVIWVLVLGAVMSVMVSAWLLRGLRDEFADSVRARADRAAQAHRQDEDSADRPAHE